MKKERRKKSGRLRIVIAALLAVVVLLAVAAAIYNDGSILKNLWKKAAGGTEDFFYGNSSGGYFADPGGGFAALSKSGLSVFGRDGKTSFDLYFSWSDPVMCSEGDYAAAYNSGGTSLVFFSRSGVIKQLETENPIVSVSVNKKGYMCVCTEDIGYGGSVIVYNSNGTDIYKWSSGAAYVLSARVYDRSKLLVLTVGKNGSEAVLMELDSTDEKARYTYDGLIIDANIDARGVTLVTDTKLSFLSQNLEERAEFDLSDKHLSSYAFADGYTAIVVGDYSLGGTREIISVNMSGDVLGSETTEGDEIGIDTAGKYFAVLYPDQIRIYDSRMENCVSFDGLAGVERIVLKDGKTVIAAGAYSAHVYREENEQ